ncbi:MAG: mandelate racemase/muconate lactonizing enzyme family protein [Anaerolineae bacterium]|nr:mandelate racemase/muconate lactonizing enzyme family protein [Anaerolineae bacterium]
MRKITDITPVSNTLYFLPVETRVPLKFGPEPLTYVTCARVQMRVKKADGQIAEGWGETPLSVQWVWPSQLSYQERHEVLKKFCLIIAKAWGEFDLYGHAIEIGHTFQKEVLPALLIELNKLRGEGEAMPWLAALVCCSAFDIALHDAYGIANQKPVYETYTSPYMEADLSYYLQPAEGTKIDFKGKYPLDFLINPPPTHLSAWHLVGGLDPISKDELSGSEPEDGYPVLLVDWIARDGIKCLKVKQRGTDYEWDYQRLVDVGEIALSEGVDWLTTDFNCTVLDPAYVTAILDQLVIEHPRIYGMILYVEQPFPYELEDHQIDVHSVSARKPLFMDESAHDWELVRLGRSLGWTGVSLKTCKTQTGALLSLCWAKAHGMTLMVQDLTNPMIAQIPHVLLAAHAGTIMGVETNAMQFYPEASNPESEIHPGLYRRRVGQLDLSTISGPGFGYRLSEIERQLPEPAATS